MTYSLMRATGSGRFAFFGALFCAVGAMMTLLNVGQAQAEDLIVSYDQSQLLRLPRPVSQVIVGNPSIADVSVQGENLLVVTGKSFGVTNIIALDRGKNVIQDQRVIVQRDNVRVVNLHKGSNRRSLTCAPICSPTITIGDDKGYFDLITKHAKAKTAFSSDASEGGSGGGGGGGAIGQ